MVMIFHSYASLPDGKWGLVEWLVEVFIWFVGDYALTHALNWPVVQCLKVWQKILSTARVGIWVWNAFLKAWSWLMIACKILGFVTIKLILWTFWASKIWGDNTLINHGWCFICSYHVIHELRAFITTNHYFTSDMFRRAVGEHFKRSSSVNSQQQWKDQWGKPEMDGLLAPDFGRIAITTTWCSKGMGWHKYTKMHIPCNLIMGHWYRVIYIYIYHIIYTCTHGTSPLIHWLEICLGHTSTFGIGTKPGDELLETRVELSLAEEFLTSTHWRSWGGAVAVRLGMSLAFQIGLFTKDDGDMFVVRTWYNW